MTVGELKSNITHQLKSNFNEREALYLANTLLMHSMKMNRHELLLKVDSWVAPDKLDDITHATHRLLKGEPLQYVTGEEFFYGKVFLVNKHVLIPRPETEELVDLIVKDCTPSNAINVLDIGTGSGCIAISLGLNIRNSNVVAVDVSPEALSVAEKNNKQLGGSVVFKQLDILDESRWAELGFFDVVVSNPPYIPHGEKQLMEANVLEHEPHLALFVEEEDPLLFYRKIAGFCKQYLNQQGLLYFECNEFNSLQVAEMLGQNGFDNVQVHKDINGKDRMISAQKNF
jgi:release factor glutamine methyltransferase